jgi:hypothetical protein
MTVKSVCILVLAEHAYAAISGDAFSMDVQLRAGRSAKKSLTESAAELRQQAARILKRAERMEQAANFL